ncbi:MAG: transposase [Microcystis sp. M061S2]|nr:transposase [Microcystis sp. M061S2]
MSSLLTKSGITSSFKGLDLLRPNSYYSSFHQNEVWARGLNPLLAKLVDTSVTSKALYIRPLIENAGAHLIFLPPYSPDFSPLENCWSKIKQILKTLEPRNYSELRQAVCGALSAITLKDIHGWFTHGCYCNSPFIDTSQSPVLTSSM